MIVDQESVPVASAISVEDDDIVPWDYAEQNHTELTDENARNAPCGIVRHSTLWLAPVLIGEFEFLEWTADDHLRHTKFIGLRDGKKARDVRRK